MMLVLYILYSILGLLTIIILASFFLPDFIVVEEKIIISAPSNEIFNHIANLEEFIIWSPWNEKDPYMKNYFEGEPMTVSSNYKWEGNRKVGKGTMTLTHIEANRKVSMELDFGFQRTSKINFNLTQEMEKTEVSWQILTPLGKNPIAKFFGPLMKKVITNDFKKGLYNLKKKIEKT